MTAARRSIVVTIPKSKLAEVEAEEAEVASRLAAGEWGDGSYYWEMGTLPKALPPRIYFVWNGAVRAWHEVLYMDRYSRGGAIFMKTTINELEAPIPMVGFRGFRYIDVEVP